METTTQYPVAEAFEQLKQINKLRKVCLVEGIAGSGKSTFARLLAAEWGESATQISTDKFLLVSRDRWDEHLNVGEIELAKWYDRAKVRFLIEHFLCGEDLHLKNLYNLSNGQHDYDLDCDFENVELLIIEGLFAFDDLLFSYADLSIFLDFNPDIARTLARKRDLEERNISAEVFAKKERIYYDCYIPHLNQFRNKADIVLSR